MLATHSARTGSDTTRRPKYRATAPRQRLLARSALYGLPGRGTRGAGRPQRTTSVSWDGRGARSRATGGSLPLGIRSCRTARRHRLRHARRRPRHSYRRRRSTSDRVPSRLTTHARNGVLGRFHKAGRRGPANASYVALLTSVHADGADPGVHDFARDLFGVEAPFHRRPRHRLRACPTRTGATFRILRSHFAPFMRRQARTLLSLWEAPGRRVGLVTTGPGVRPSSSGNLLG